MYLILAPSDVASRNDPVPVFTPGGCVRTIDGKTYKYVKLADESVTPAAGQPVWWSDTDTSYTHSIVTNDFSEAMTDTANDVVGILTYAATEGNYTFVQTWGYYATVINDGTDLAKGAMVAATADGVVTVYTLTGGAMAPLREVGYCVTAITATSGPVFITIER